MFCVIGRDNISEIGKHINSALAYTARFCSWTFTSYGLLRKNRAPPVYRVGAGKFIVFSQDTDPTILLIYAFLYVSAAYVHMLAVDVLLMQTV